MKPLFLLIDACKKFVGYYKRSNLQSKLSKTLKHENQIVCCLFSIHEIGEVVTLLIEKDKIGYLNGINQVLLKQLIDFLQIFRSGARAIQAVNSAQGRAPATFVVCDCRHQRRRESSQSTEGCCPIVAFKKQFYLYSTRNSSSRTCTFWRHFWIQ